MRQIQIQAYWGLMILSFLIASTRFTHCAPSYADYENVRDLYELLLQKQLVQDNLSPPHQIVRKTAKAPSLRLRFGKKSDPYLSGQNFFGHPLRILDESTEN